MKRLFGLVLLLLMVIQSGAVTRVKILAIGNSFSEDAVEQNLHELAAAEGIETIIGNMYIPGCPLELHAQNMKTDARAYRYRKIDVSGKMVQIDSMSLSKALADEDWDYISLQQASQLSGLYDSYQPYLHELIAYIRTHVSSKTRIVFHQTWSYAQNSTRAGYENYGENQLKMYRAIMKASQRVMSAEPITLLIPSGTAIQNARTSSYGDTMNRDGFHLNLLYGRYTAACTWFATLFKRKVEGNRYAPEGMTPRQIHISQLSADTAVRHPYEVTKIEF